jgi:hypothetical protein
VGTTNKTATQNQYDPTSMGAFQGLTPGFANTVGGYMNNPFSNPFFQTQQQLGTSQAQKLGQTQMNSLLQNQNASGMGGGSSNPAALEMQQNQARANTGLQSQLGFLQPVQNALGMQQGAMQMAGNYKPLQTGGTQTQSTQGLGTWLPQLLGAVGGAGMSALTGGLFGGGGGGTGGVWGSQNPGQQGFQYGNPAPTGYGGGGGAPPAFGGAPTGDPGGFGGNSWFGGGGGQ